MTNDKMREWIEAASYEDLLRRWRFAPAGDPFFSGNAGNYFAEHLIKKRDLTGDLGVSASKRVGWDEGMTERVVWNGEEPLIHGKTVTPAKQPCNRCGQPFVGIVCLPCSDAAEQKDRDERARIRRSEKGKAAWKKWKRAQKEGIIARRPMGGRRA